MGQGIDILWDPCDSIRVKEVHPMDIVTLAQESTLSEMKESLSKCEAIKEFSVSWMALGGIPSVFVNVSLDSKDSWSNGIFQNSRYAQFCIHDDMKLEQISVHYQLKKHRKCKISTVQDVVNKIQKWAEVQ
jgi:hypothetical protein